MGKYLVCGLTGTGKTTVAKILAKRGFETINMDDLDAGVSFYRDKSTGEYIDRPNPPFSADWLRQHEWVWDGPNLRQILATHTNIFLCGDASNEADFYHLFDQVFGLYVDSETELIRRLQKREPQRWQDGSADLSSKLERNRHELERLRKAKVTLINADQPPDRVVEDIIHSLAQK